MQLALDLARNFLVLVPVTDTLPGDRRILKFSYEEQRLTRSVPPPAPRTRKRDHQGGAEGQGRIEVTATTLPMSADASPLEPHPESGLEVRIWRCDAQGRRERDYRQLFTDRHGKAIDGFPAGRWEVEELIPPGLMEQTDRIVAVDVKSAEMTDVEFKLIEVVNRKVDLQPELEDRDEKRLQRGLGWYSKPIEIRVPAVAACASYHLEVEAPEEIAITRADLTAATSIPTASGADSGHESRDEHARVNVDYGPVQRAHLHLDGVTQGYVGRGTIRLRSQPSTVLRPALFSSVASMLLLAAVAWRFPQLSTNVGSVATILLFVPGLLSAYVVRPREHPMATSLLFGHRVMAITASACALVAAVLLLLERTWAANAGRVVLEPSWELTQYALWLLTGVSGASVILIAVALRLSSRPPESLPAKHPGQDIGSGAPNTPEQLSPQRT